MAVTTIGKTQRESAVDAYKRKHPEDTAHVDKQVQLGKKALEQRGLTDISREDMTMEEYQRNVAKSR